MTARGAGLDDEPVAKFGFRETWIEGRQVFLNGTPFRMRPTLMNAVNAGAASNNLTEAIEMGFNFGEIWPAGTEERSTDSSYTHWYDKADKAGFPISGMTPHMGWMGGGINSPAKQAAYRAATERVLRRYRNHPSIIMWGTSGNMFGSLKDPKYVGIIEASRAVEALKGTPTSAGIPFGDIGVRIIKSVDPTRPVFVHNGGSAGDIYTANHYLNFIPLQEREEWLSNYVVNGEMPLMYVEFGTPVNISLMRGRNGFTNAYRSEHWLSEFASIYLGNEAYKLESADYRKKTAGLFEKDQSYQFSHGMTEADYSPSWQKLQDLFIRNTWRSWRTMGMTGGMVPWDMAYSNFKGKRTPAGEALRAGNSETLAWIVGAAQTGDVAAFTAKDHSFFAGEPVRKQIALLNDSRSVQKYTVRWTATVDGKPVGNGEKSGDLAVGNTLFVPFEFAAPTVTNKTGGVITMDSSIGDIKHTDSFEFRVWPRAVASRGNVSVFDPEGKTSAMLR
ncbi:MAG TPA: glycoside hydrolase family 2 TIM barrel-domain containing protein, partial [Abditibacteriaceae bacterium]